MLYLHFLLYLIYILFRLILSNIIFFFFWTESRLLCYLNPKHDLQPLQSVAIIPRQVERPKYQGQAQGTPAFH